MKKIIAKKNPIIPRMGVCDPHVHIFQNKAYMYASHDYAPGRYAFRMDDWQIWSSPDLVEWTLEQVVRPEDFYIGPCSHCWAVDCAERNGKYYYYYSEGSKRTGVAVSDTPYGPFKDPLGKPLLDGTLTPTREYDPCVFKDDDGEYYLVFGGPSWAYGEGCGYFIARLNEDMISLAEQPRRIELNHMGDDKASLNKFNGKYYLSYGGFYAISDCVYGPYTFMGHTGASIDHTSYFEWNNQLFHAITIEDSFGYYRSAGLCYVHIRKNGELVVDPMIVEYGVGQYDSAWNHIEAEWYMKGVNVWKEENAEIPGFSVACEKEAFLFFPKIRGLSDKVGVMLVGEFLEKGGVLEVRLQDENGPLLASAEVARKNFPTFQKKFVPLHFDKPLPDVTDICIVMRPNEGSKMILDYFYFVAQPIENP